jgi:hypothetical protein
MTRTLRMAIAACFFVSIATTPWTASARLDQYVISGTITSAELGLLFPGKSIGETFQGSFTLDTNAMLEGTSDGGKQAFYSGEFSVVIDGLTYPGFALLVWSSGPAGIDDGFEISFLTDDGTGFLSLRSNQDLYTAPTVPTMIDLMQMDELSLVSLHDLDTHKSDEGEIEFLPEAGASVSALAAIAALVATAQTSSASRCRGTRRSRPRR